MIGFSLRRLKPLLAAGLAAPLLAGCASYVARPVSPAYTAGVLESRTLNEPRLTSFIAMASPSHAGGVTTWDISTLTLAALYYHPEVDISRNRLALAQAGVVTARQVPNPTLSVAPGNGILASEAPSPLTIGFLVNFIIETFGKREIRTDQAKNLVEAARQDLATAAWQIRSNVRTALLDLWAFEERHDLPLECQSLACQT